MRNISVILPCYNEQESIKKCIEDFNSLKVNEIIAIDNNSNDDTKTKYLKQMQIYF